MHLMVCASLLRSFVVNGPRAFWSRRFTGHAISEVPSLWPHVQNAIGPLRNRLIYQRSVSHVCGRVSALGASARAAFGVGALQSAQNAPVATSAQWYQCVSAMIAVRSRRVDSTDRDALLRTVEALPGVLLCRWETRGARALHLRHA
eukprot:COSAG02_NODE_883_length_16194_cov_11.902765_15_plen_147_part_00